MTTCYRANSYCIAVGFPHRMVTANQAQNVSIGEPYSGISIAG